MKKAHLLISIFVILIITECKKNSDGVFIRIENKTSDNFINVLAADTSFGNVDAGAVTDYKMFLRVSDKQSAVLITSSDTLIAGFLYYDEMFPVYLPNGRYTLQIFYDTLRIPTTT